MEESKRMLQAGDQQPESGIVRVWFRFQDALHELRYYVEQTREFELGCVFKFRRIVLEQRGVGGESHLDLADVFF